MDGGGRGHIVRQHDILLRVDCDLAPVRQLRGDHLPKRHRRLPNGRHRLPHGHERVGGLPPAVDSGPLCVQALLISALDITASVEAAALLPSACLWASTSCGCPTPLHAKIEYWLKSHFTYGRHHSAAGFLAHYKNIAPSSTLAPKFQHVVCTDDRSRCCEPKMSMPIMNGADNQAQAQA